MGRKATHEGTCQICGRVQRLPNGFLAKHGYKTTFGYFQGVCWGSKELPYEQSCDVLHSYVQFLNEKKIKLIQQRDAWLLPATSPHTQIHIPRRGIWMWERCEVQQTAIGHIQIVDLTGEPISVAYHRPDQSKTLLENADLLNKRRADQFSIEIRHVEIEIDMATRRIANWKENQPLKELLAV